MQIKDCGICGILALNGNPLIDAAYSDKAGLVDRCSGDGSPDAEGCSAGANQKVASRYRHCGPCYWPSCARKKRSTSALKYLWNAVRSKPGGSVHTRGGLVIAKACVHGKMIAMCVEVGSGRKSGLTGRPWAMAATSPSVTPMPPSAELQSWIGAFT